MKVASNLYLLQPRMQPLRYGRTSSPIRCTATSVLLVNERGCAGSVSDHHLAHASGVAGVGLSKPRSGPERRRYSHKPAWPQPLRDHCLGWARIIRKQALGTMLKDVARDFPILSRGRGCLLRPPSCFAHCSRLDRPRGQTHSASATWLLVRMNMNRSRMTSRVSIAVPENSRPRPQAGWILPPLHSSSGVYAPLMKMHRGPRRKTSVFAIGANHSCESQMSS
jgi:hypothetical protein